jgi:hypothetical protein
MSGKYRIMQAGRKCFYVEHFSTNLLGLFPKWRPLRHCVGMALEAPVYFPTLAASKAYADEHAAFGPGPKIVG